jgi:hypothetical protein
MATRMAGIMATTNVQRQPRCGRIRAVSPAATSAPTGQPDWTKLYMNPRRFALAYISFR